MKVSKLWLREWVNFSFTEQELANQLTMAGLKWMQLIQLRVSSIT